MLVWSLTFTISHVCVSGQLDMASSHCIDGWYSVLAAWVNNNDCQGCYRACVEKDTQYKRPCSALNGVGPYMDSHWWITWWSDLTSQLDGSTYISDCIAVLSFTCHVRMFYDELGSGSMYVSIYICIIYVCKERSLLHTLSLSDGIPQLFGSSVTMVLQL